jgi:ubiquinone/menaquinone biosynthesis C-methylase UbiE
MHEVDYQAVARLYDELIREHGDFKEGILLDLACGTGTLSRLLSERGWDIIGVDSSEEMLLNARRHEKCSYIRQDMTELDLYGTINAAVCSLDGLNHLADESELAETLRRVSLFTEAGGVFVFDVNTLHKHETTLGRNTFIKETPCTYCVWQNHYQGDGVVDIVLNIFAKNHGELTGYSRYTEEITEKAYDLDTIRGLCEQSGFEVLKQCEFPGTNLKDKVVFVCRKI